MDEKRPWPRPRALLVGALALGSVAVAGCHSTPTDPPTTSSSSPSSPSPSTSASIASIDLTDAGRARAAVSALVAEAGASPIIRVTLTRSAATLTFVDANEHAQTLRWRDGAITQLDSDVSYVQQTAFNPANFAFDDLTKLFALARVISGSGSNQELQINQTDEGTVLMSVSTDPESTTVFFRADGSLIRQLDYTVAGDLAEGLSDVLGQRQVVLEIGYRPEIGLWADLPSDTNVVERRVRPARLPTYTSRRTVVTSPPTFSASVVDPTVLAKLMTELPARYERPGASVSFVISATAEQGPTIRFDVGGLAVITDLGGQVISPSPR